MVGGWQKKQNLFLETHVSVIKLRNAPYCPELLTISEITLCVVRSFLVSADTIDTYIDFVIPSFSERVKIRSLSTLEFKFCLINLCHVFSKLHVYSDNITKETNERE